jgi:phenylacetate-CoA ligase
MSSRFAQWVYSNAPSAVQSLLMNVYAFRLHRTRFGSDFDLLMAKWEESQWWEPSRLKELQDLAVRDMVRFAAEQVPFYGRYWADHGANASQVHGVDDLALLPTVTKANIRDAGDDMLSTDRSRLAHGHTSGTTGTPLDLWYDDRMVVVNNVADWRQKRWGGLELGDWCALFLGRMVVPTDRTRPPFWRANHVHKQLWCSSFHLSEETLPLYLAELKRRGIQFLDGYPSSMQILAQFVLRRGEVLPMKAVFTSSETLHAVQREAIESAFDCPVFDFYGHAERVIFAGECEAHAGKHIFDEYGVTEVVDPDGRPVPDGTMGVLTGTSLWNRGMPLIRYETGDISALRSEPCSCGRGLRRLADVATKAEDILVTPEGRYVSPSVLTHPFKPYPQLKKSQIIQDEPDHVLVKLQASDQFREEHRLGLVAEMQNRLGPTMRIETVFVDEIEAEPSGKFRWVICRVGHDFELDWQS